MESHEHTYIIKDAANKDEGRITLIFYLLRVYSYLPRVCLNSKFPIMDISYQI